VFLYPDPIHNSISRNLLKNCLFTIAIPTDSQGYNVPILSKGMQSTKCFRVAVVCVSEFVCAVCVCSISVLSRCIPDESYLSSEGSDVLREYTGLSGGGNLLRKFFSDLYNMRHKVFVLCCVAVGE